MCDACNHAEGSPVEALPASAEWKGEVLALEPVDELTVLTVCDNTMDMLLPDEGPAKRLSLAGMSRHTPMLEAPTLQEGKVPDAPLAQHGFSALVEVRKGDRVHRILFDTGVTPDGCADNLRRLGRDPAGIEAIVCSHGHFDHATGLSGLNARGHRRVPSHRPPVRTDHRQHRRRAGAARTRRDHPRPLHGLESHARDRAAPARRVHPEQRRHHLPLQHRTYHVGSWHGTASRWLLSGAANGILNTTHGLGHTPPLC